jgi:hypothetical protein
MISKNPDFLSPELTKKLVDYGTKITEEDKWDKSDPNTGWHNRYIHAGSLKSAAMGFGRPEDLEIFEILIELRKRIKDHIIQIRGLGVPLYADTLQLVRWLPGNEQHPHADSENEDGSPHPFPWRDYASVTYLNKEYEGGRIYFPQHNLELQPEPGTMVTFPGSTEYMHGVSKVESGIRYTVASFWTLDASKHDGLPI